MLYCTMSSIMYPVQCHTARDCITLRHHAAWYAVQLLADEALRQASLGADKSSCWHPAKVLQLTKLVLQLQALLTRAGVALRSPYNFNRKTAAKLLVSLCVVTQSRDTDELLNKLQFLMGTPSRRRRSMTAVKGGQNAKEQGLPCGRCGQQQFLWLLHRGAHVDAKEEVRH